MNLNMNLKLLIPTYRTRYLNAMSTLKRLTKTGKINRILHLGCGEGDYCKMIKKFCNELHSCDINSSDLEFAKILNNNDLNINYSVQDAQRLAYNSNYFDFVISIDIIEHVPDSIKMIREINRVLKKNGQALITCPNYNFPFTYDPINRLLRLSKTKINFGAYGFGHYKLMNESELEKWFIENNFKIVSKRGLSKYLVGLLEMYWSGIMQKLLKENSLNQMSVKEKKIEIRPGLKEPPMLFITDLIIKIDKLLFSKSRKSIGLSYLLEKK